MTAQEKYDLYLNRYCASRKISREEAVKHRLVQETKKCYEEDDETKEEKVI